MIFNYTSQKRLESRREKNRRERLAQSKTRKNVLANLSHHIDVQLTEARPDTETGYVLLMFDTKGALYYMSNAKREVFLSAMRRFLAREPIPPCVLTSEPASAESPDSTDAAQRSV